MTEPDYSWIKPGALAVIDNEKCPNSGAVVRCLSVAYFSGGAHPTTGIIGWGDLVDIEPVTPINTFGHPPGTHLLAQASFLRPLPDFPEEADTQEVSIAETKETTT